MNKSEVRRQIVTSRFGRGEGSIVIQTVHRVLPESEELGLRHLIFEENRGS